MFLPGESRGQGSLVGCRLWGCTESDTTEATAAVVVVAKFCLFLLQPHGLWPTRLFCPWDSPGNDASVGCCALLQGIFLTQELNSHLLHWQVDSLPLSHQGSPDSNEACSKMQWVSLMGPMLLEMEGFKHISGTIF